jgi:hypothetical protein
VAKDRDGVHTVTNMQHVQAAAKPVRSLIEHILRHSEFRGRAELLSQVPNITIVGGPITMVNMRVTPSTPPAPIPDGPVPVSTMVIASELEAIGEIIIWVKEGRLDGLEYAWYTDSPPDHLPTVEQLVVGRTQT